MQPDLELPGSVKAQRSTPNKDAKRSGADDTEADESQAEACAQLFQVEEWRGGGGSRCMDVTRRIVRSLELAMDDMCDGWQRGAR